MLYIVLLGVAILLVTYILSYMYITNYFTSIVNTSTKVYAEIILIGFRPSEPTKDWVIANGSTRTYALLINSTRTTVDSEGYGAFKVWAWLFSPISHSEVKKFEFRLTNQGGSTVHKSIFKVKKTGMYYQVLVLIKVRPGKYVVQVTYPTGKSLEVPITVYERR